MNADTFELILSARDELSDTLDAIRQRLEDLEQATVADALTAGLQAAAAASADMANEQSRASAALAEALEYARQTSEALARLPAGHQLVIDSNLAEIQAGIAQLQQPTFSTHTIQVQRLESPSGFAEGGTVFRRLPSPHIDQGSGHEDDVPALLMRNEFVLRAEAVKKYGLSFLYALNNMQYPLGPATWSSVDPDEEASAQAGPIQGFARGGQVKPAPRPRSQTSAPASTALEGPPLIGPDPDTLLLGQAEMLSPEQVSAHIQNAVARASVALDIERLRAAPQECLESVLSGFEAGVRVLAAGGAVGQADEALRQRKGALKKDYDERIALARAAGNENIANLWAGQLEILEALIEALRQSLADLADTYRTLVEDAQREHRQKVEELRAEYGGLLSQARATATESQRRASRAKQLFGGSAGTEHETAVRAKARALAVEETYARKERAITGDSAATLRQGLRRFQLGTHKEERQAVLDGLKTEREAGHAIRMTYLEALQEIRELESSYARELAEAERTYGRTQIPGYTQFFAKGGPVALAARFAAGGAVTGGIEGQDSVPALLMPGEYVLSVAATRALGTQYLNAINGGFYSALAPLRRFASGGLVGSKSGEAPVLPLQRVEITLNKRTASLKGTPDNVRTLVTALRSLQRALA